MQQPVMCSAAKTVPEVTMKTIPIQIFMMVREIFGEYHLEKLIDIELGSSKGVA